MTMDLTQDDGQGESLEDLFAKFGIKKDGTLCSCLQEVVGEGKGPGDVHAREADLAIMARADDTGNILTSALHVLLSLVRAGIAERVLHEGTIEAAKASFLDMLMSALGGASGAPGGPEGLAGLLKMPGLQVLELGQGGLRNLTRPDVGDQTSMRDGYL